MCPILVNCYQPTTCHSPIAQKWIHENISTPLVVVIYVEAGGTSTHVCNEYSGLAFGNLQFPPPHVRQKGPSYATYFHAHFKHNSLGCLSLDNALGKLNRRQLKHYMPSRSRLSIQSLLSSNASLQHVCCRYCWPGIVDDWYALFCDIFVIAFNPLRGEFSWGNVKSYLHFLRFRDIKNWQVEEILPCGE